MVDLDQSSWAGEGYHPPQKKSSENHPFTSSSSSSSSVGSSNLIPANLKEERGQGLVDRSQTVSQGAEESESKEKVAGDAGNTGNVRGMGPKVTLKKFNRLKSNIESESRNTGRLAWLGAGIFGAGIINLLGSIAAAGGVALLFATTSAVIIGVASGGIAAIIIGLIILGIALNRARD